MGMNRMEREGELLNDVGCLAREAIGEKLKVRERRSTLFLGIDLRLAQDIVNLINSN